MCLKNHSSYLKNAPMDQKAKPKVFAFTINQTRWKHSKLENGIKHTRILILPDDTSRSFMHRIQTENRILNWWVGMIKSIK